MSRLARLRMSGDTSKSFRSDLGVVCDSAGGGYQLRVEDAFSGP